MALTYRAFGKCPVYLPQSPASLLLEIMSFSRSSEGFILHIHASLDGIIGLPNCILPLQQTHNICELIGILLLLVLLHRRCLQPIWILRLVGRYLRDSLLAACLSKFPKVVEPLRENAWLPPNLEKDGENIR